MLPAPDTPPHDQRLLTGPLQGLLTGPLQGHYRATIHGLGTTCQWNTSDASSPRYTTSRPATADRAATGPLFVAWGQPAGGTCQLLPAPDTPLHNQRLLTGPLHGHYRAVTSDRAATGPRPVPGAATSDWTIISVS